MRQPRRNQQQQQQQQHDERRDTPTSNEQAWQESFAEGDATPIREAADALPGDANPGDQPATLPAGEEPAADAWRPGASGDEHGHGDGAAGEDASRPG